MTAIKRGQVLLIDLNPTKGSETGKIRPCIVVTNDTYNARVPIIQVVPVTEWNDKKERIATNVVIEPSPENGLTKKSVADCLQTRPVDHRERLVRSIGEADEATIHAIDTALRIVFDLH